MTLSPKMLKCSRTAVLSLKATLLISGQDRWTRQFPLTTVGKGTFCHGDGFTLRVCKIALNRRVFYLEGNRLIALSRMRQENGIAYLSGDYTIGAWIEG
jgi:hypothetical protein